MTQNSTHTVRTMVVSNGGGKAVRVKCSCGALGTRFAFTPATVAEAKRKALATGEDHLAGKW